MKITTSNLIRWAGLSAVAAGILFVFIQIIHPPEVLASVTTGTWIIVHYLAVTMCVLWMLGLTGIYSRQSEKAGWFGLAGFVLMSVFLTLTAAFNFAEALIVPLLATDAPKFVEGWVGIVSGAATETNLGLLPTVYLAASVMYLLGGVLLGIATFRGGILPRWAGATLVIATLAPLVLSFLLPKEYIRLAAVPMGVALVGLGYSLWSERRAQVSQPVSASERAQLRPSPVA